MLENPQDESVVRWGDQGDSFVVLEVRNGPTETQFYRGASMGGNNMLRLRVERKIYETYPAETLQTQQLCQFCPPIEQVRLSQSPA